MSKDSWRPWSAHRQKDNRRDHVQNNPGYQEAVFGVTSSQTLEQILIDEYPRAAQILWDMGNSSLLNLGFKAGQVDTLAIKIKVNSYPFTCELGEVTVTFSNIDEIGMYLTQHFSGGKKGRKKQV